MPYGWGYGRRRGYTRRRNSGRWLRLSVVPPPTLKTHLQWNAMATRTVGGATQGLGGTQVAVWWLRANNPHDPDLIQSVGQLSATGWQRGASVYNHYVVLASRTKCTFSGLTPAIFPNLEVGIIQSDVPEITETTRNMIIMNQADMVRRKLTGTLSGQYCTLSKWYNPKQFFGLKSLMEYKDVIGAQTSSPDPIEKAYIGVFVAVMPQPLGPTGQVYGVPEAKWSMTMDVQMDFLVEWSETKRKVSLGEEEAVVEDAPAEDDEGNAYETIPNLGETPATGGLLGENWT